MERVTGIGGVFFRAADPAALAEGYPDHLGVPVDPGQTWASRVSAGATVEDRIEEMEYGRFAWARYPEGNRFELWEPAAEVR